MTGALFDIGITAHFYFDFPRFFAGIPLVIGAGGVSRGKRRPPASRRRHLSDQFE
jgi:hypothetical protein